MAHFLVSGASTGIGEACARRLDRGGHHVFAGVRRPVDAERLKAGSSERLRPVFLDVADAGSIHEARDEVEETLGEAGLHGIVNNAGIAVAGPLEHVPIDALRHQLEVNVVGQVAVTQAFLPRLRRAGGRIVLMGSVGGRMSTPFLGPYCASKFALEAIADALRVELQPWGLHVAIVEPGSIATPIWTKSDVRTERMLSDAGPALERDYGRAMAAFRHAAAETGRRGLPPESVAGLVEHALLSPRPRTRYLVGRGARLRAALVGLMPDRMRDRLLTRALNLPPAAS
ncbi:MAG TPA: SDR family oxidoreductase [Vicinamibacterales bacterium]|nr:SDR family oxidoreductase [Vicinamibacterales bacterium]